MSGYPPPGGYGYAPPPYPGGQGAPPPYSQSYPMGHVPPPGASPMPGYGIGAPQPAPVWNAPPAQPDRPQKEFCFFIENEASRLVFEVEGAAVDPGVRVVTSYQTGADNQLWYEDTMTGTIRSRLNMMCIKINEYNTLILLPYTPGDVNQQWLRVRERIQNRNDPNKVLMSASLAPASPVVSTPYGIDARQTWTSKPFGLSSTPPSNITTGLNNMSLASNPTHYFCIRSEFNNKVLDVDGAMRAAGTRAIMWPRKSPPSDNQLWYIGADGIIRSKLTNFVLEPSCGAGSPMCMNPYEGKPKQTWIYDGNRITRQDNRARCVEIQGANSADGATVCTNKYNGSSTQHWALDFVGQPAACPQPPKPQPFVCPQPPQPQPVVCPQPPIVPTHIRYFFIRSAMHGKVLDVDGGNPKPGTKVILWPRKGHSVDNQLWYMDNNGCVRSKLNDFVLRDQCGKVILERYTGHPGQMWVIRGNQIVQRDKPNICLDITAENRADGAGLCQYPYKGSSNQHWIFDYTS